MLSVSSRSIARIRLVVKSGFRRRVIIVVHQDCSGVFADVRHHSVAGHKARLVCILLSIGIPCRLSTHHRCMHSSKNGYL
jgi:hypothetical protein